MDIIQDTFQLVHILKYAWFVLITMAILAKSDKRGDEQLANTVNMTIYDVTISQWENEQKTQFTAKFLEKANSYCSSTPRECGLNKWDQNNQFEERHLVAFKGFPMFSKPSYLMHNFSLEYPASRELHQDTTSEYFVPRKTVMYITVETVESYHSETGKSIIDVSGQGQGLTPNHTPNYIIIPIAIIAFLVLLVVLLVLLRREKKEENRKRYAKASTTM